MMRKAELRSQYKRIRHEIEGKSHKSIIIQKKLTNTAEYRTAHVIALYHSLPDEVHTAGIMQTAFADNKTVCLPKITGDEIQFYAITPQTAFAPGAFGILEPTGGEPVSPAQIDLVIVPLLAADTAGYRLGFGGGYYDRFLSRYTGYTIGICYKEQLSPVLLPHEAHDVPLNKILSD